MLTDINSPLNDTECWIRYPKYRWVYETTRLLKSQNIKWSFIKDNKFNCVCPLATFNKEFDAVYLKYSVKAKKGEIYVEDADNFNALSTDVIIHKGEIKWLQHHSHGFFKDYTNADIELRISAFVIMNFQKWSGVLSIKTIDRDIYCVKLMPDQTMLKKYPEVANTLLKKIYKKIKS